MTTIRRDATEEEVRQAHQQTFDIKWARELTRAACSRTLQERVDEAVVVALHNIENEAGRELNETVIDFVRVDVRDGVWHELLARGFHVTESKFRCCSEVNGDAVPSLVVRW